MVFLTITPGHHHYSVNLESRETSPHMFQILWSRICHGIIELPKTQASLLSRGAIGMDEDE